jgi:hypothetical protein
VSVTACLRWLPFWLPASSDPAVARLPKSGFADRHRKAGPGSDLLHAPIDASGYAVTCLTALVHAGGADDSPPGAPVRCAQLAADRRGRVGGFPSRNVTHRRWRRGKDPPLWSVWQR